MLRLGRRRVQGLRGRRDDGRVLHLVGRGSAWSGARLFSRGLRFLMLCVRQLYFQKTSGFGVCGLPALARGNAISLRSTLTTGCDQGLSGCGLLPHQVF